MKVRMYMRAAVDTVFAPVNSSSPFSSADDASTAIPPP